MEPLRALKFPFLRSPVVVGLASTVGLTVVLWMFKAKMLSGMSMGFASSISAGGWGVHSHHLLYGPMIGMLERLFGGGSCDIICLGQAYSIVWAAVSFATAFVIANKLYQDHIAALAASVVIASTHGFLVYSTQLEPYVPLLGVVSCMSMWLLLQAEKGLGWIGLLGLSVLLYVALSLHQAAVLFLIPMAYLLWVNNGVRGILHIVLVAGLAGVAILLTYYSVFLVTRSDPSFVDFFRWILYYQIISDEAHGTFSNLLWRLKTFDAAFVQTYVMVPSDFWHKVARIVLPIVAILVFAWHLRLVVHQANGYRERTFLLIWLATFTMFFFWWKADVYKFFIPTITPMILLVGWAIVDLKQGLKNSVNLVRTITVASLTTILLIPIFNYYSSVKPLWSSAGEIYRLEEKLATISPPQCNLYAMRFMDTQYYWGRQSLPFNLMFRKHYYSTRNEAVYRALNVPEDFEGESCGVIPLLFLSRDYFANRTKWAIGAYLSPTDWELFVNWYFDVTTSQNTRISHSAFTVLVDDDGDAFVVTDRTRKVEAMNIGTLTTSIESHFAKNPGRYYTWSALEQIGEPRKDYFGYH